MKTHLVALLAAPLCAVALAQTPTAPASTAAATSNFRCGGVGQAEQQRMKAEAANHDALLTFSVSTGAYITDVDVRITDSKGAVVVQGRCDGPMMLVDLPANGRYQVTASSEGRVQRKSLTFSGKTARAVFVWPAS